MLTLGLQDLSYHEEETNANPTYFHLPSHEMDLCCCILMFQQTPKIIEPFRLEKNFKIIDSNSKPSTAKSRTKPCSQLLHLHV